MTIDADMDRTERWLARAKRADAHVHDVAQTHLPEFVGGVALYPGDDRENGGDT